MTLSKNISQRIFTLWKIHIRTCKEAMQPGLLEKSFDSVKKLYILSYFFPSVLPDKETSPKL